MFGHDLIAVTTAIAAVAAAVGNYFNRSTIKETKNQVIELKVSNNHRLDELVEAVKAAALLQGEEIGKNKEKARALAEATEAAILATKEKPKLE